MDEFDKIRELTEDLTSRKEPTFTGFYQIKKETDEKTETVTAESSVQQGVSEEMAIADKIFDLNPTQEAISAEIPEKTKQAQSNISSEATSQQEPEVKIYDFSKPIDDEISFIPMTQNNPIDEKSFPSLKLHLILIFVLIVVLGISLAGFFMFKSTEDESDEVVMITASPDVVKELPKHAGGMVIPDQDKLVYNRIRSDNVTTKVESLFPEPEKPVVPQILTIEQNAPETKFVDVNEMKAVNPLEEVKKEEKPLPAKVEEKVVVAQPEVKPVASKEEVLKPKKEEIELKQTVLAKPQKEPVVSKEIWRVQLFASNSKVAVEKAWKNIQKKHVKLLSNMSYLIKKVEIPGKGNFYRLQVGQFPSRAMADGMCSKLKAKKQDCLPVK